MEGVILEVIAAAPIDRGGFSGAPHLILPLRTPPGQGRATTRPPTSHKDDRKAAPTRLPNAAALGSDSPLLRAERSPRRDISAGSSFSPARTRPSTRHATGALCRFLLPPAD